MINLKIYEITQTRNCWKYTILSSNTEHIRF